MSKRNTPESFWLRVDKTGPCWTWVGGCNSTGYGVIMWHGKVYTVHRLAAWLIGLVPTIESPPDRKGGGYVLHRCDNRRCCRPDHLFIGTYADNLNDAYAKGRRKKC